MKMHFISTTELQKNPKKILQKEPVQIVLTNNKISGMLLSADLAGQLIDSDVLQQIREEFWELQDRETVATVAKARKSGKSDITLEEFRRKYDV